jgi:hypothetical protein
MAGLISQFCRVRSGNQQKALFIIAEQFGAPQKC